MLRGARPTSRERVGELAETWQRRGDRLDFGVGIALGYATLGKIGFEGRFDYGAIGTVTNLAARLQARLGLFLPQPHMVRQEGTELSNNNADTVTRCPPIPL